MNPFLLSPQERLTDWKSFRKTLLELPEQEQLSAVATYWSQAPLATIAHDVERPDTWPTPWEMISEGEWCRNSVAIGAEFTLRLAGWDSSRLTLAMIRDWDVSEMVFVVIIDESKLINYTYGSVSEYPKTRHDLVSKYRFSGRLYTAID